MTIAVNLNSAHVEETFKKLNKKIVVKRHPSTVTDLLWSHHEKLVIIDQVIAYVGGLDLCDVMIHMTILYGKLLIILVFIIIL